MYSTVLGVIMEDESIQWSYYTGDLSIKNLTDLLCMKYNDYEEAKKLVHADVESLIGPVYKTPINKKKPFQNMKAFKESLKDDIKKILIFEEYEGWYVTRSKERIGSIKRR